MERNIKVYNVLVAGGEGYGHLQICGEKAGWLRSYHKECRRRYDAGKKLVDAIIIDAVRHGINRDVVEEKVSEFAKHLGVCVIFCKYAERSLCRRLVARNAF